VVQDDWQGKHIGSYLFKHLVNIARRHGIAGFTAEVLSENRPMQAVFRHSGLKVTSRTREGVVHFDMEFS